MQIKKLTPLVVALALTACGGETSQQIEEPAGDTQVVEENSTSEEYVEEEPQIEGVAEDDETNDPNYVPEYAQVITPVTQTVQAEAGTNEESNYFNINGLLGDYVQTGDAFITTHKYEPETKILIIPIKATNKYKEDVNISTLTHTEFKLIQEDDNSIYQCSYAVTPPDEYQNDITTKTKVGGEGDYYLAYKVEKEGLDFKLVSGLGDHIVFANIKNH